MAICSAMLAFQAGTFITHYAADHLDYSTNSVLFVNVVGGLCAVGCAAVTAILSDSHGRRRITLCAFAFAAPWAFAVFPLVEMHNPVVFGLTVIVTYAFVGLCMGPLAAFLPETFATRYRYTGAGLAFNLAGIVGGALPPLVAGLLVWLPLAITIWVLSQVLDVVNGVFGSLLIALTLGQGHVLWQVGAFFSQLAIVTFGGAYAVPGGAAPPPRPPRCPPHPPSPPRATSCGPRTSRLMVKVLAEEAIRLGVPIFNHATAVRLLVEDGSAAGVLTIVPGALVIWFVRNYIAKGFALGRV